MGDIRRGLCMDSPICSFYFNSISYLLYPMKALSLIRTDVDSFFLKLNITAQSSIVAISGRVPRIEIVCNAQGLPHSFWLSVVSFCGIEDVSFHFVPGSAPNTFLFYFWRNRDQVAISMNLPHS